jgi:hypothetical protein
VGTDYFLMGLNGLFVLCRGQSLLPQAFYGHPAIVLPLLDPATAHAQPGRGHERRAAPGKGSEEEASWRRHGAEEVRHES